MNSWLAEIKAVAGKELRSELRNPSSTFTSLMLTVSTVFTLAFAFNGRDLEPESAAGLLWAALIFAGVGTLTRAFVAEEEQGTGDLLRLWARPHAVYWGKVLFAACQMLATSFMVAILFLLLTGVGVQSVGLLMASLGFGSLALAGLVTIVSAIISRGSNRGTLGGVVALPLLLPLVAMGVLASRAAFDGHNLTTGWTSTAGIGLYAGLVLAIAPHLFAAIFREN